MKKETYMEYGKLFSEREMIERMALTNWLCEASTDKVMDLVDLLKDTVDTQIVYVEVCDLVLDACSAVWLVLRRDNEDTRVYVLTCIDVWIEETTGNERDELDYFHPVQIWQAKLCEVERGRIDFTCDVVPSPIWKGETLTRESYLEQCQKNRVELQQEIQERNKQTSS